jgi:hypothetical protein
VIILGSTTEDSVSAEMAQPSVTVPPEQEQSWQAQENQAGQQVQQIHTTAADQRGQRAVPGRRPLFRT